MLDHDSIKRVAEPKHELGLVLCSRCGKVLCTLPTNGVKRLYGVCRDEGCLENRERCEKQDG